MKIPKVGEPIPAIMLTGIHIPASIAQLDWLSGDAKLLFGLLLLDNESRGGSRAVVSHEEMADFLGMAKEQADSALAEISGSSLARFIRPEPVGLMFKLEHLRDSKKDIEGDRKFKEEYTIRRPE